MSIGNAQADLALDWQGLLDSTEASPDLLPSVVTEREILGQNLGNFKVLKARQQELTAQRHRLAVHGRKCTCVGHRAGHRDRHRAAAVRRYGSARQPHRSAAGRGSRWTWMERSRRTRFEPNL